MIFMVWLSYSTIKSPEGMPSGSGGSNPAVRPAVGPTGLPAVLKSEKASEVILKYMEGLLKRTQKIADPRLRLGQKAAQSVSGVRPG